MRIIAKWGMLSALGLAWLLLAGCGAGSGTTNSNAGQGNPGDTTGRGSFSLQIVFPSARAAKSVTRVPGFSNGNIPAGTRAVKVEIVSTANPATALAIPQVLTNSGSNVTGAQTVTFTNLTVGAATVRVTAYPDAAAQLTPIALGTSNVEVVANTTVSANISLTLTIDHITVSPVTTTLTFSPNPSGTISATPFDKNNNPLLMPLLATANRPDLISVSSGSSSPTLPTTQIFTVALTTILSPQPVAVTVTFAEPNSGKTATATVNVPGD